MSKVQEVVPILYRKLLYKMGNYLLDILYNAKRSSYYESTTTIPKSWSALEVRYQVMNTVHRGNKA